jgi:hypothetical protein
MPATAPANRTPSTPKASTALIGFAAKLWLKAVIGVHGHMLIPERYGYSEAREKIVRGNQRELGYVR